MASSHLALFKAHYRLCPEEVACEGVRLTEGREMCPACEAAIKRRKAPPKPLRGERCETYYATRVKKKKRRMP